jgi:hypothetical protein
MLVLSGCTGNTGRELNKWNVTLDETDKRPYGAFLTYKSLQSFFPGAKIQTLPHGSRFSEMDDAMMYSDSGRALAIFAGLDFYLSDKEWDKLKEFISNGNDAIIFCSRLDSRIEQELNCYKLSGREEYPLAYLSGIDKGNEMVLSLVGDTLHKFGYKGRWLQGYFYQNDTSDIEEDIVGDNRAAEDSSQQARNTPKERPDFTPRGYMGALPDFVSYKRDGGRLLLHAAPLVLSNYFLLQPGNEQYLAGIWNSVSPDITRVYWSGYFKRTSEESSLRVLFKYPATRLAIQLGLLALVLYILFEGKRKQRVIPVLPPIKNDSVSFVETVGRLYYNKGNHANLANKMVQQFLEWVRMRYLLNTNLLNGHFIEQLSIKSGQPVATVEQLIEMIHEIKGGNATIDEAYLYQLYTIIQQFYKNHPV